MPVFEKVEQGICSVYDFLLFHMLNMPRGHGFFSDYSTGEDEGQGWIDGFISHPVPKIRYTQLERNLRKPSIAKELNNHA